MIDKPFASLSLDLDNKWSYMKTHGDPGWETFPSYLDVLVPRVLDLLSARNLHITFFIVGQDAALENNREALGQIAAAHHEIGNHSFNHEPWMHLYSQTQIEGELARAEEHIQRATGYSPVGFRGPGYACSPAILRALKKLSYLYDASILPTYIGPLARAYYFLRTELPPEEKERRKTLFGKWSDGRLPLRPYRWRIDNETLFEIPLTTMPILRLPVHFSYILYLSSFSRTVALNYLRIAIKMCRGLGIQPSLLLHPLDFLGADDETNLSFFPGMQIRHETKLEVINEALSILEADFLIVDLKRHVGTLLAEDDGLALNMIS